MTTKDTGGPAFPVPGDTFVGMTLRDYFAAKAMQNLMVLCANDDCGDTPYVTHVAAHAYTMADAMLAERAK